MTPEKRKLCQTKYSERFLIDGDTSIWRIDMYSDSFPKHGLVIKNSKGDVKRLPWDAIVTITTLPKRDT